MKNPYDRRYRFMSEVFNLGHRDPLLFVKQLYLTGEGGAGHPMSGSEISEWFYKEHKIMVTPKTIETHIKNMGVLRSKSESKRLAMQTGRMVYKKKPEHEKYRSKSISAKIRVQVFTRDKHVCQSCGNGPKTGYSLEIHHKNGPENNLDNLETLCFMCHRGLHAVEKC